MPLSSYAFSQLWKRISNQLHLILVYGSPRVRSLTLRVLLFLKTFFYIFLASASVLRGNFHKYVYKTHTLSFPKIFQPCTLVFVLFEDYRDSLHARYEGHFQVFSSHEKIFLIQHPTRTGVVALDRLNPASFESIPDPPEDFHNLHFQYLTFYNFYVYLFIILLRLLHLLLLYRLRLHLHLLNNS